MIDDEMMPGKLRIPVISILSTHEMPLVDFKRRSGAVGQIGEPRIHVLGQLLDDREVVLLAEILLFHVVHSVVDVTFLIDRRLCHRPCDTRARHGGRGNNP